MPTTSESDYLEIANETLRRNLASLEQMVDIFPRVFELDIATRARRVRDQLQRVTEIYFHETWDTSEVVTSSLDLSFSELEYETGEFSERVQQLDESINQLNQIYERFVLSQAIVMLVGSLEVYLSTVFACCLSGILNLNDRAISKISGRYNFQNWGDSVDAFRTFLEIELCPEGDNGHKIAALQQKRHVLVHRMGVIDERAACQLNLPARLIGKRLRIEHSEVIEGIELIRRIGSHLHHSTKKRI
jgi:hypothetical protein